MEKDAQNIRPSRKAKAWKKPDISFGATIRAYRLRAQLEQEQVAQAFGVTPNCVSNWERGVSRPDLAFVPALCALLKMPLAVFFGQPEPACRPADEQALLADYRELTRPNQRLLRKTLSAILESQAEGALEALKAQFCCLQGHENGLAAGFGAPLEGENTARPLFVRASRTARLADDVFPVNGKSMEPDYPDGSRVFVQRTTRPAYGDVVVCVSSGVPYIKIYGRDGLRSINPDYPVIRVGEDDNARVLGRVLGLVPEEALATSEEQEKLLAAFADEIATLN